MSDDLLPPPPPTNFVFKPNWRALLCWLIASGSYAVLVGFGGQREALSAAGVIVGGMLALGVVTWLVAAGLRRIFKRSNSEANLVFCAGVFAFTLTSIVSQYRNQQMARAALAQAAMAPTTAPAPTVAPAPTAPAAMTPSRRAALDARRQLLAAEKFLREKSAAQTTVALLEEGKPWRWIDKLVQTRTPEFKRAYQTWRTAEIEAGNDPKVSDKEFSAIMSLHAIRMAIGKYRLKNERPPTIRHIATLPVNPITGQKAVARNGIATRQHGWSYDENTGRIRIVLPAEGKYNGLHKDEIDRVKK
ncbi:MAG: hypothetical protein QOF78_1722 [Phycisphaerales bacterium]|jgi:hypothetical protein|nr:hypothetical protein [Phycisphaerales bacterium]